MTTYYVDDATGNNSDAGTSEADAWQTLAKAASSVAAGDLVNVKNTNDYTITAAVAWSIGGTCAAGPVRIRGYTTTPGDGGRFICKTSTNSINMFNIGANMLQFQDFELKHQAATKGRGIVASGGDRLGLHLINGRIEGCTYGIDGEYVTNFAFHGLLIDNMEFVSNATVAIAGHSLTANNVLIRAAGDAWRRGVLGMSSCVAFNRTRIYAPTGYGLKYDYTSSTYSSALSFVDGVIRGCGSDGVYLGHGTSGPGFAFLCENSIIYGNGGYGFNAAASSHSNHLLRKCAFRSNTSGNYNSTYFSNHLNEITLTADPHNNAAAYDFSLNTAGADYASLKAAGFSGDYGGVGYLDIGGVQHQDAGGGGGGGPRFGPHGNGPSFSGRLAV